VRFSCAASSGDTLESVNTHVFADFANQTLWCTSSTVSRNRPKISRYDRLGIRWIVSNDAFGDRFQ
jgi:hypothetical protein